MKLRTSGAGSCLTGLDKKTVLRIFESADEHCARLLDAKIRNVKAEFVQADELVNFVFSRGQNTPSEDETRSDFFTCLAFAALTIHQEMRQPTAHDFAALDNIVLR